MRRWPPRHTAPPTARNCPMPSVQCWREPIEVMFAFDTLMSCGHNHHEAVLESFGLTRLLPTVGELIGAIVSLPSTSWGNSLHNHRGRRSMEIDIQVQEDHVIIKPV